MEACWQLRVVTMFVSLLYMLCNAQFHLALSSLFPFSDPGREPHSYGERNIRCNIFWYHSEITFVVILRNVYFFKQLVIATTLNLLVYALPLSSTVPQTSSPTKGKGKGKGKKTTSGTQQASSILKLLHTVETPASIGGGAEGAFRAAKSVNPLAQIVMIHVIR